MPTFTDRQLASRAAVDSCACWLATVFIALSASPSVAGAGAEAQAANARLGLRRSTLQRIALPVALGEDFSFDVVLDGQVHTLHLKPYSIRSPRFRVRVDIGGGVLRDAPTPASRTYRGVFEDGTGSVRASVGHDGLSAVLFHNQREWYIEPNKTLRAAGSRRGLGTHVVYAHEDVLPDGGVCGHEGGAAIPAIVADRVDSPSVAGGGVRIAEIAFDTDHEYYTAFGSSVTNVVNDIERIMNAVDEVYDAQFGMRYEITDIIVRADPSDPYTTDQPVTLLQQFQLTWITLPESDIPRDLAHFFTGRSVQNDVIGFATLGSVCDRGQAFGFSRSRFTSNFARRVDLTTHEIGHNWNAPHCNTPTAPGLPFSGCCDAPTYTMCEFIGFSVRNSFCPPVIAFMSQFMDSRSCLDIPIAVLTLPFSDEFVDDEIDGATWTTATASVDTAGDGEPSPPLSVRLNGADRLASAFADASNACGVTVEYWWQRTGTLGAGGSPEPGEDLTLEYRADSGLWEIAAQHPGDGPDDEPFEFASISLPPDAAHAALQIRFSIFGNAGLQDNFFVDDVMVRAQTGVEIQTQPTNQSVCNGAQAAFHVTATGDAPLTFQWMKNGSPLEGETGESLVISAVGASDLATYSVEVGNACGTAVSNGAELTEIPPVAILTQPSGATLTPGESFFAFVTAAGIPTYQWFKNNLPIAGETGFSFRIPQVVCSDAGSYHCELENACSAMSTETVELIIDAECVDQTPPYIVHGNGLIGGTRPHSGYIDPRMESTDGSTHDLGITRIAFLFSEPVEDVGDPGGGLTPAAFTIRHSGGGDCPQVVEVDTSNMPLVIATLCRRIPLNEWTTILVTVQDLAPIPNVIVNLGDLGLGVDENDRLDLAALPCDVDQNGRVQPLDLLRFRQIISGVFAHPRGIAEDYVDMDRQGTVAPIDLLRFRQLYSGTGQSIRAWSGAELLSNRP